MCDTLHLRCYVVQKFTVSSSKCLPISLTRLFDVSAYLNVEMLLSSRNKKKSVLILAKLLRVALNEQIEYILCLLRE